MYFILQDDCVIFHLIVQRNIIDFIVINSSVFSKIQNFSRVANTVLIDVSNEEFQDDIHKFVNTPKGK